MQCKVPDCKREATHTFAKAPVCEYHREDLQQEAEESYADRPLFESIRQYTLWKVIEPGDVHRATVKKIKKDVVTIYEIRGGRYVLDHPSAYKGARAK
ncbi:hypothetical protein J25TS5_04410 [Paenibacillus faecis]|nr:hypothetical protein J25TS5_04410 [Paenibacillus faecis]